MGENRCSSGSASWHRHLILEDRRPWPGQTQAGPSVHQVFWSRGAHLGEAAAPLWNTWVAKQAGRSWIRWAWAIMACWSCPACHGRASVRPEGAPQTATAELTQWLAARQGRSYYCPEQTGWGWGRVSRDSQCSRRSSVCWKLGHHLDSSVVWGVVWWTRRIRQVFTRPELTLECFQPEVLGSGLGTWWGIRASWRRPAGGVRGAADGSAAAG